MGGQHLYLMRPVSWKGEELSSSLLAPPPAASLSLSLCQPEDAGAYLGTEASTCPRLGKPSRRASGSAPPSLPSV